MHTPNVINDKRILMKIYGILGLSDVSYGKKENSVDVQSQFLPVTLFLPLLKVSFEQFRRV